VSEQHSSTQTEAREGGPAGPQRQNPDTSGPNPLGEERAMVGKTGRDLADGEYPGLILPSPYFDVLGEPRPWFKMLVYGREGSGKSTFVTGLCKAYMPYARHMDAKILYCSSEEGPSDTSADRVQRLNIRDDRFVVTSFSTLEELKEVVEDIDAQFVVLDSASALRDQSGEGVEIMKFCERQGRAVAVIAHQNSKGEAAKARDMRHECGIEIQCVQEQMPPGKARAWGLDIKAPERQGEGGEIIVHLAKKKKNRFGGRVKAAPVPMKEDEIRETIPDRVIDRRVRKLKAHNQWPMTGGEPDPATSIRDNQNGYSGMEGESRHPGEPQRPNTAEDRGGPETGQPEPAPGDAGPSGMAPPDGSAVDRAVESPVNGQQGPGSQNGPSGGPTPRPNRSTPKNPTSLMGFPSFIRTNPAQKVDLDEFESFTLRELIENNGNAARSVSYLNKFIGWERGCVAEVSNNESPDYRSEEGGLLDETETLETEDGEVVNGKLLSFTYERFPKSTARPDAVAVTRMYLNDKLVDTICADTAKETIEIVKEKYGDLEIKVLSQEHLQDAFGVEEFRRLASEIPKRQDEDKGTVPSNVRTEGFASNEVSPRGHINTDMGLVDKRVINLAKEAANGEFTGMDDDEGEVLSEGELPASADHGVELFGTEYIFYETDQFELEVSTGDTFFVGSRSTRGDTSLAESLMGFNFGAETNLSGEEPEQVEEEVQEEEEEEPDMTEEVEEAGPPDVMAQVQDLIDQIPGDTEAGFFGTHEEEETPTIDSAALEILTEMAGSVDREQAGSRELVTLEIAGLTALATESDLVLDAPTADDPFYQLSVKDNDEGVDADMLVLALQDANLMSNTVAREEEAEEEPESVGEALGQRAEEAAGIDDDIVPGGFAQTSQGMFVGGDGLAILQEVSDDSTQSSVTFELAGETLRFSVEPAPTKFIGSEENGAFLLTASSEAAQDLSVRGLLMAFDESGAMRRQAVSEQVTEPAEEEEEPEPAPEPSTPEPEEETEASATEQATEQIGQMMSQLEDL